MKLVIFGLSVSSSWGNGHATLWRGLCYTGGRALTELSEGLGARRVLPLYGSVDPDVHFRAAPAEQYRSDLSYLGTYAEDRQSALEKLFLEPARQLPERRFLIGGAM